MNPPGYTRVPHPEPSSLHPPRTIPLGHASAPAPPPPPKNTVILGQVGLSPKTY